MAIQYIAKPCDRSGCDKSRCRMIDVGRVALCDDCHHEFFVFKDTWPAMQNNLTQSEFQDRVQEFLDKEPGSFLSKEEQVAAELQPLQPASHR